MVNFIKKLLGFLLIFVVIAVIGLIFFFEVVNTASTAMIPTLVPGDTFLMHKGATLGRGDIAVCKNPANPSTMVVLRVVAVPGENILISRNHLVINGKMIQHDRPANIVYEDNTSGEHLKYLVGIGTEFLGGRPYNVALMKRAGDRTFDKHKVQEGFFLVGDNRNRARDSRHFGEMPIEDCIGRAIFLLWPGDDCGDLKRKDRLFNWIY